MPRAKGTGTSTPRSRGAYGSKRGTPDKQNARKRSRDSSGRVRGSMEDARAAQAKLDALMAHQAAHPAVGSTQGAQYAQERADQERLAVEATERAAEIDKAAREKVTRRTPHVAKLQWEGDPKDSWTIRDAQQLLRAGYTVQYVTRLTGVGYKWLNDIPVDSDMRATV